MTKACNLYLSHAFHWQTTRSVWIFLIAAALGGCATVPEHMQVSAGISPINIDTNVRFRTTYYFRVFDFCHDSDTQKNSPPVTDSMYRFVMTGKANPYANEIRFESGTLKSSQIDPFGATVERDEASGRYRFVSEPEVQARAERANALAEVENLIRLNQRLLEMNRQWKKSKPGDPVMLESTLVPQTTFNALETKINESVVNLAASGVSSSAELPPDAEAARLCPPGSQTRRGFQTMGPQGMKTFDQDERLIMAMTSEAKPLISTLTEVSSRILKSEEASLAESDLLLPLMREQLRVSNMRNLILRNPMSPDFNPGAFVGALTEQLDFEEE